MSTFKENLNQKKTIVENKIKEHIASSKEMAEVPERLKDAMAYALLAGGKRLRPVLSLIGSDLVMDWMKFNGVSSNLKQDEILEIALAVEMIHTYSLVHDDLPAMDDDDMRRGNSTCHIMFDEATAILAGDALLNQSFEVISRLTSPQISKVLNLIATAAGAKGMIGGQMIDMMATGKSTSQKELEYLHSLKTGKLIKCAVLAPVFFWGVDELMKPLEVYGEKIGLAFQVMDDVLEVTQDSATLGKSANSDIENDKSTYVKLMGVEAAQKYANQLVEEAKEKIASLELGQAVNVFTTPQSDLIGIADYIVNRNN